MNSRAGGEVEAVTSDYNYEYVYRRYRDLERRWSRAATAAGNAGDPTREYFDKQVLMAVFVAPGKNPQTAANLDLDVWQEMRGLGRVHDELERGREPGPQGLTPDWPFDDVYHAAVFILRMPSKFAADGRHYYRGVKTTAYDMRAA